MLLLPGWVTNLLNRAKKYFDFFNGSFVETFDALVTSDGATITMTLEQVGGGNLTMNFSDGLSTLVCVPALTIALTEGTDEIPKENFVYILQSTKALTVSTSDWPTVEHIKVSHFVVQSASLVNTGAPGNNWALVTHNINDHAANTDGQGHMSEIAERERKDGAKWDNGCEGVATDDVNDCWVSITAGVVFQLHSHTFLALDSDTAGAGDVIVVVNDPDSAYTQINSLNEITKDASGVALGNNKFYKAVLFGIITKTGEVDPMGLLLPTGTYNTAEGAARDVDGKSVFDVPVAFVDTAFLIAAFVLKHTATATEIQSTVDLRGRRDTAVTGSGTGGGDVTAAAVLTDDALVVGDGGAKGVQSLAIGTTGKAVVATATANTYVWRTMSVTLHAATNSSSAWTNMAAAEAFFISKTVNRAATDIDLSDYTQVRLVLTKTGVAGDTGAKVYLKYFTAYSTTVGDYLTIGTSEVSVTVDVTNDTLKSSWIALAAGAKADVSIALTGDGGDGAKDPQFGAVVAQFR